MSVPRETVFKQPKLVDIHHLSSAIDYNAAQNADHPVFQFIRGGELHRILWRNFTDSIYEVTRLVIDKYGPPEEEGQVIALVVNLGAFFCQTLAPF